MSGPSKREAPPFRAGEEVTTPVPGTTCVWGDEVTFVCGHAFPTCITHNYPASPSGPCLKGLPTKEPT